MAKGKHPFPSRTRPLSLSAPMVLHAKVCGRVGVARDTFLYRFHFTHRVLLAASSASSVYFYIHLLVSSLLLPSMHKLETDAMFLISCRLVAFSLLIPWKSTPTLLFLRRGKQSLPLLEKGDGGRLVFMVFLSVYRYAAVNFPEAGKSDIISRNPGFGVPGFRDCYASHNMV